ncbi:secretion system protein [Sanguibacter sp. HDW7]|uniref:secretion system protein n=1 Tax=Sanguibacter sp. HDW7 TaxID=2714931 RepID=UPI00140BE369|nr:secretion system protein [Sanguibacter sp. HDW7]QIK84450.1 secretion system protein [Sanguibacter sp. HDW7]
MADAGVVLELLAVATSATSLPDALRVVGDAVGGPTGLGLTTAGAALVLGAGWDEAWATVSASADEGVAPVGSRLGPGALRGGRGLPATPSVLGLVAGCLRPAWEQGAAPASALRAARDRHDREAEARAVEAAERLAVRVVVPLGLCLLPAFVLLGLVPTVIALGSGLL